MIVLQNGSMEFENENDQTIIRCTMDYTWYPFDTQICSHSITINEKVNS